MAVDTVVLTGRGAAVPGIAERLSAALGVPARVVAPADIAACDPGADACRDPGVTTAVGLAQHEE
jgi:Tfp pilus assembly PilM family ATPase